MIYYTPTLQCFTQVLKFENKFSYTICLLHTVFCILEKRQPSESGTKISQQSIEVTSRFSMLAKLYQIANVKIGIESSSRYHCIRLQEDIISCHYHSRLFHHIIRRTQMEKSATDPHSNQHSFTRFQNHRGRAPHANTKTSSIFSKEILSSK